MCATAAVAALLSLPFPIHAEPPQGPAGARTPDPRPAATRPVGTWPVATRPPRLHLRYATFDPLVAEPAVPAALSSGDDARLCIVQFAAAPTSGDRDALEGAGGRLVGYLPEHAYLVRLAPRAAEDLRGYAGVRWVGRYHPAYRLEPELRDAALSGHAAAVPCHVVVADKRGDKPALLAAVQALGGIVDDERSGSLLVDVTVPCAQLARLAARDDVLWIERRTEVGLDVDNARVQGGAAWLEAQAGYTGAAVNAHVYEGIEALHPDFPGPVTNVRSGGQPSAHGHATAGILFGAGTSAPVVRGIAPDAGRFYTTFTTATASRWEVCRELVELYDVSLTTASWGHARTLSYTAISAEADDIVFDHDLAWTQAQGNGPGAESRPEAWAKNVLSIGGVTHFDDADPSNDTFLLGPSSTGPAADGRIKPTLVGYQDAVGTSDLTGAAGYGPGDWFADFGGNSAAAPMVGGFAVLAIEMFADDALAPGFGVFGNPLRQPGGTAHQNRPHAPTLKALLVASARQYPFGPTSIDRRRLQQGWGFPDVARLYDDRARTFVVDELAVLQQGETDRWQVTVPAEEPSLRVCLSWNEPPANPAAAQTLVNDLSLAVTSPGGVVYRGNVGLDVGVWSQPGGAADATNPIECVFVADPEPGVWTIDVVASAVVLDGHVETPAVDCDYGLVVVGGFGPTSLATAVPRGAGCFGVALSTADRPLVGASVALVTSNAPANTLLGVSILSFQPLVPPLDLGALGMPGCALYQPLDVLEIFLVQNGTGATALAVPNAPGLAGLVVQSQAAVLAPGVTAFDFATTNGLVLTVGLD